MHLQYDWISIPTVNTFPTLSSNPDSFKDRKSKTLTTFSLSINQPCTGISGSHLTACNLYEKLSISREFLHLFPQQILPKEDTCRISASCLLFGTSVSMGIWKWKITFKNTIWRRSISRSCPPKWPRHETETGHTKKGISLTFQGDERLGMWECTAYCFLALTLPNVTIMLQG